MSRTEFNSSFSEEAEEFEDDKVVETDPINGRYVRFDHKLGSGAFKTVYRALDTERGIEVAWNQVPIDRHQLDKEKILQEIDFFKKIRHEHIIEFYYYWTDKGKNQVVFITELMPSGTLTDYIEKSPEVKLKIIKSWCTQILKGLNYLHSRSPPIIHRDIKCGNIFINGTTEGEVKIGDLGLATFCKKKDGLSIIGTPEFMAPEYYNEIYSTSVDIWAFGMAMIEMVTRQCPYGECDNVAQIFKKVTNNVLPSQLGVIEDKEVKDFILLCFQKEENRPTAAQLLDHPFFSVGDNDNMPVKLARNDPSSPQKQSNEATLKKRSSALLGAGVMVPTPALLPIPLLEAVQTSEGVPIVTPSETSSEKSTVYQFDLNVIEKVDNILTLKAAVGLEYENARETSEIDFTYVLGKDVPSTTASELVKSFELDCTSYYVILSAFENLVANYPSPDRKQIFTELSELLSDSEDTSDFDPSVRSEPLYDTPKSLRISMDDPNSDTETVLSISHPFLSSGRKRSVPITEIEFLASPRGRRSSTEELIDIHSQNTTDLEDLLDDTVSEENYSDDDDDLEDNCFENNVQVIALKQKLEEDLRNLANTRDAEIRQLIKKQKIKKQKNVERILEKKLHSPDRALQEYYTQRSQNSFLLHEENAIRC